MIPNLQALRISPFKIPDPPLTNISNLHTSGVSISGWARYYVDSQDHTSTALSGFLEPQITQNASDILFVSGLTTSFFSSGIGFGSIFSSVFSNNF